MNLRYFVFPLLRQFQLSGMPETSLRCFQVCNFETPWKYKEVQKSGAQIRDEILIVVGFPEKKNCFWVEPNESLLLFHSLVSGKTKFFRAYPFASRLTKTIVACWNGCLILGKREEDLHRHEICQNIFANVVSGGKQLGRKAFIHYTIEIRTINLELNKA